MANSYFDDLVVGQAMRHARGKTITDVDNVLLSNLMLNTADGHFNEHAAAQSSFGGRMVFGLVIAAIVVGIASEDTAENAVAELGLSAMRFRQPVLHGDTLYASTEVIGLDHSPGGDRGEAVFHHWGLNQNDDIVFECDRRVLLLRRRERAHG
jgi:acyl dehydratase